MNEHPEDPALADAALDDVLRRLVPEVPSDADQRVLRGLTPERIAARLARAELERTALRALLVSAVLAVAGVTTLAGTLLHARGPHAHARVPFHRAPAAPGADRANDHPLALAEATRFVSEARRIAAPFPLEEKK